MDATSFCTWLKGFFEISGEGMTKKLTAEQVERIRLKLEMVPDPADALDPPELSKTDDQP
jgi:hypothetical protein